MAVPTVAAVGTGDAASAAAAPVTPTPPAHQADDILVCAVAHAPTAAITAPGDGWAEVADSPQQSSTTENGGARLTVFWKRAVDGSTAAPNIDGYDNHAISVVVAIRGCITTGNPWDVTAGSADGAGGTAISMPGDTTTVAECLILNIIALGNDDAISAWANADLANVAERYNVGTSSGNDSQLGIASGEKATAGAFGATTATAAGSVQSASLTIAFKPPAGGGGGGSILLQVANAYYN